MCMEMGGGAGALEVRMLAPETRSVKKFPAPLRKKCPGKEFCKEDGSSEGLLADFLL